MASGHDTRATQPAHLQSIGLWHIQRINSKDFTRIFRAFIGNLIANRFRSTVKNLADRIARDRPSLTEAVRLAAEFGEALHFTHERGFIHREIKPVNVPIDGQSRSQVTDFGIATTQPRGVPVPGLARAVPEGSVV